jgi:hypothetical protein
MRTYYRLTLIVVVLLVGSTLACTLGGREQPTAAPARPTSAPAPVGPPAAPSDLGAATISATQINLDWQDNANNEGSFRIYRAEGTGAFTQAAQLPANTASYQDKNLKCNTQYRYRVTAVNPAGESAPSNTVEAYTGMCP